MNYLKGYSTNPQIRVLHNVRAVQSRKGWKQAEVFKAMEDAGAGIAYEVCAICSRWKPLDCGSEHKEV
jgi:hypothetical protein